MQSLWWFIWAGQAQKDNATRTFIYIQRWDWGRDTKSEFKQRSRGWDKDVVYVEEGQAEETGLTCISNKKRKVVHTQKRSTRRRMYAIPYRTIPLEGSSSLLRQRLRGRRWRRRSKRAEFTQGIISENTTDKGFSQPAGICWDWWCDATVSEQERMEMSSAIITNKIRMWEYISLRYMYGFICTNIFRTLRMDNGRKKKRAEWFVCLMPCWFLPCRFVIALTIP